MLWEILFICAAVALGGCLVVCTWLIVSRREIKADCKKLNALLAECDATLEGCRAFIRKRDTELVRFEGLDDRFSSDKGSPQPKLGALAPVRQQSGWLFGEFGFDLARIALTTVGRAGAVPMISTHPARLGRRDLPYEPGSTDGRVAREVCDVMGERPWYSTPCGHVFCLAAGVLVAVACLVP